MNEEFSVTVDVKIRRCRETDLRKLEWFGSLTPFRGIIQTAFERQEAGEVVMLVAEVDTFPIGQLWVDLTKRQKDSIGVLWAFRVLTPFQGNRIGSRLLTAAEKVLQEKGYAVSEIGVEKDNPGAKRLYERMGYRIADEVVEEWDYMTPEGEHVVVTSDEWTMHKMLR